MAGIMARSRLGPRQQLIPQSRNRPFLQNGSVLRLVTETNRLLVDVESDIVDSSHTVLLTWFLSQPATAGLIQHFCSTIGRTSPSIHSNNRQRIAADGILFSFELNIPGGRRPPQIGASRRVAQSRASP